MDESKLELKVGALVLLAVGGGLALLALMGELGFGGGKRLLVDLSHTGNVVKGAPVKLGGVQIGKVENVELFPTRRDEFGLPLPVTLTASVTNEAGAALKVDTAVTISSQGPLGEPYLELNPGSAETALDFAKHVRGTDAPRIDLVSNRLAKFLEVVGGAIEKDPEAITRLIGGVSGLTRTVDGVITDNRADIRQIAQELGEAAKDLRALSAALRVQFEPGGKTALLIDDAQATAKVLRADVPVITKQAQGVLGGAEKVAGQFTEEDGRQLRAAMLKYAALSEKLDGMASRADRIFKKIEAGEGTAGAMIQDKQVYDDLKALLADLRKHPWKMLWKD
ncbi:MAG: MCE family protein [Myxococcaceae bacterium]|nr:MCE family protein [Myxococcaceae bacterium]